MATITKAALHYMQDEHEALLAERDELEEELAAALEEVKQLKEENDSLKAQNQLMMADRSVAV